MIEQCSGPSWLDYWGVALAHTSWQLAGIACAVAFLSPWIRSPRAFSKISLQSFLLGPIIFLAMMLLLRHEWIPLGPSLLAGRIGNASMASWIAILWMVGIAIGAIMWCGSWLRVLRLGSAAQVAVPTPWRPVFADCACEVRLIDTHLVTGPVVIGWRRPLILVPCHCLQNLSIAEGQLLLQHEQAHLARQDFFWNSVQTIVEIMFFYHPATWLLTRWIRSEREFACDDVVLSQGADKVCYANALAHLASQDRWLQTRVLAAQSPPLRQRVERVLRLKTSVRIEGWQHGLCWLGFGISLGFCSPPQVASPPSNIKTEVAKPVVTFSCACESM